MVGYQYTYLIGDIILLTLWLILFLWRKDIRKEMLIISLIFSLTGPFVEAVHILDWWKPLTITNTSIGIEDFLFGFGIGGVASVIYAYLFNKRVKIKKVKKIKEQKRNINFLILLALLFILFFGGFFILNLNSFESMLVSFIIAIIVIYTKRSDLIKDSLVSGVLVLIISILGYHILNFITPGFFDAFWLFQNIGRIIVLGIPLEEHIFYFLAGALLGPLYEYWKEGKLINIKK
jgi:hypothetical protein